MISRPLIVLDAHLDWLDATSVVSPDFVFGVGPYLRERFKLTKAQSHIVVGYWMDTFAERHAQ